MEFSLEWIKELPIEQIRQFEDKVVYNCALYTREFTKNANAYPYLTGELMRSEVALPIETLGTQEYGLGGGVSYAKDVWKKTNVKWTNSSTKPQWYYTMWRNNSATILAQAFSSSLKEIK